MRSSYSRPSRLNEPAVLSGFVALDEQGFLHKPFPFASRHVNHHGDAVHHTPAGDLPGKLTPVLHGATGDPRQGALGVVGMYGRERSADAGKVKQPKGLRRQRKLSLLAIRYHTVVRNGGFLACGITYDNNCYQRGNAVSSATVLPQATPTRERVLDPAPGSPPCAAAPDSPQAVRPR